ncbi:MAG: DUF3179 domain-containing protein [Bacteroidales bacterium]|nr:DUF3179 domain-containing protein [Bacteroidales bacterium]
MKTSKISLLILLFSFTQTFIFCSKTGDSVQLPKNTGNGTGIVVVLNDEFEGTPIVLAGSAESQFIISFINDLQGKSLEFEAIQGELPLIMKDNEGNKWDITGTAAEGPSKGQKLTSLQSYMGYWFSWGTFFPGAEIYDNPDISQRIPRLYLNGDWLIPSAQVLSGGPGKDGIPALKNPDFVVKSEALFMNNEDLILGLVVGTEARAYPHKILDWHEIINDEVQGEKFVISYCPLTGTGIGWAQRQHGVSSTFGVSGLLYNSNLIPYDRESDSYWSQMRLDCIKGSRKGEKIETIQLIETNWGTWKNIYPNTQVVSTNTGYSRNYNRYPYGNYKTDETVYFPVSVKDSRLHAKEVVHGIIINDIAKIYRFEQFR